MIWKNKVPTNAPSALLFISNDLFSILTVSAIYEVDFCLPSQITKTLSNRKAKIETKLAATDVEIWGVPFMQEKWQTTHNLNGLRLDAKI